MGTTMTTPLREEDGQTHVNTCGCVVDPSDGLGLEAESKSLSVLQRGSLRLANGFHHSLPASLLFTQSIDLVPLWYHRVKVDLIGGHYLGHPLDALIKPSFARSVALPINALDARRVRS